MQEVQLADAKKRKEHEAQEQRVKEIEFMNKLRREIDDEKEQRVQKKLNEREVAQKVIHENEQAKAKMVAERERDREVENKAIEEYNRMLEAQEQKRQREWKAREEKISLFMNRMADTVAKSNEAERELERRVVQYQVEKEHNDALKEQFKKDEAKRKLNEIKRTLDTQVNAKKQAKQQENYMND